MIDCSLVISIWPFVLSVLLLFTASDYLPFCIFKHFLPKSLFQDRKVSGHVYTKTGKWAVMYIHICKGYWLLHLFQRFFYRILELFWQWYFCFRFITIYICTEGNYLFKIWCLFYIFVFVGRTLTSKTVLLVVTSFRWPLFVL